MKAIIYARFSSKEQGNGTSLERQIELCESYCKIKGWQVVDKQFDQGVSAWSGANMDSGSLATITNDLIRKGGEDTVIVVEQLDRITRRPPNEIVGWLNDLTASGAALATVNDKAFIDTDSFSRDPTNTIMLVMNAFRAFSESQHKSDRLTDVWDRKRKSGKPLTKRTVGWVELIDDELRLIEDRADIIRKIFQWALNGFGPQQIATKLNESEVPTFGRSKGWHISYIKKLLKSRSVIGEYQPRTIRKGEKSKLAGDPIPDYYPAVISARDFQEVQNRRKTTTQGAARQYTNLLSGIAICAGCRSTMTYLNKGLEKKANGSSVRREYLRCENSRRGLCDRTESFQYQKILNKILDELLHLAMDDTIFRDDTKLDELTRRQAALRRSVDDSKTKAKRLLALVESGDDMATDAYLKHRKRLREAEIELKTVSTLIDDAMTMTPANIHLNRVNQVRGLLDDKEHGFQARAKVKAALDSVIDNITFWHNKRWLSVSLHGLAGGFIVNLDTMEVKRRDDWKTKSPLMASYNRRKITYLGALR